MSSITDKDLEKAKKILGETAKEMTDEQLKDQLVKIQYLTETWLDEFERQTLDGQTLAEKIPGFNNIHIMEETTKNE